MKRIGGIVLAAALLAGCGQGGGETARPGGDAAAQPAASGAPAAAAANEEGAASASETAEAEAFVRQLYARYTENADVAGPAFRDEAAYAPSMIALIERDRTINAGEVGALDHDPICQCQDWENLAVQMVQVTPTGAGRADAQVSFRNVDAEAQTTLKLERTAAGWRVADVIDQGGASVAETLRRANAQAAAAGQDG